MPILRLRLLASLFQFLIGRLGTSSKISSLAVLYQVSIPHRKARNTPVIFKQAFITCTVSIPHRKARN